MKSFPYIVMVHWLPRSNYVRQTIALLIKLILLHCILSTVCRSVWRPRLWTNTCVARWQIIRLLISSSTCTSRTTARSCRRAFTLGREGSSLLRQNIFCSRSHHSGGYKQRGFAATSASSLMWATKKNPKPVQSHWRLTLPLQVKVTDGWLYLYRSKVMVAATWNPLSTISQECTEWLMSKLTQNYILA